MSNLLLITPLLITSILLLSGHSRGFLRLARIVLIILVAGVGTVRGLKVVIITLSRPDNNVNQYQQPENIVGQYDKIVFRTALIETIENLADNLSLTF